MRLAPASLLAVVTLSLVGGSLALAGCASSQGAAGPGVATTAPGTCPTDMGWPTCTLRCEDGRQIDLTSRLREQVAGTPAVIAMACRAGDGSAALSVTTCQDGVTVPHGPLVADCE